MTAGPPDAFAVPAGFDLVHVLPEDPKAMGEAQEAIVAVAAIRAGKVAREVGEDAVVERRPDGSIVVRVPCGNRPAFRSWLLGLLDDAVVLEPPEVRAEVTAWLGADRRRRVVSDAAPRRGPRPAQERLRRLLVMLPWLMERGEVPVAEAAERFGVSEAHLIHDLEVASLCGLPPYVDELVDLWIDDRVIHIGVPRLFTRPLRLTAPEGFALLAAGRAAMALPGADPAGPLGRALEKLAATLGVTDQPARGGGGGAAAAARRGAAGGRRTPSAWPSPTTRPAAASCATGAIDPQTVYTLRGRWYVVADDSLAGPARTFRVDRIESATPTGERFEHRDVPIERGEFFGDADTVEVTLLLPASAAWVAETYPVHEVDPEPDGRLRVRLAVASERWLERVLLRAGPEAEVVEPAGWRTISGARRPPLGCWPATRRGPAATTTAGSRPATGPARRPCRP